jgi:Rieske Fe-S protein
MGCRVYRREEGIVCPCHGSAFQIDGKRIGGPSPRSLRSYLTFPVGKKIVVLYL